MIEVAIRHELRDLAIDVAFTSPARTLALFGDSGAGKTSAQCDRRPGRAAARASCSDGQRLFDSRAGSRCAAAAKSATCPGRAPVPHLDVRANLLYGRGFFAEVAASTPSSTCRTRPMLARRPGTVGGEHQRVAIGRALLATAHPVARRAADRPAPLARSEGRAPAPAQQELALATVLVSHQPDEVAALADEVVRIDGGRVIGQPGRRICRCTVTRSRRVNALPARLNRLPRRHSTIVRGPPDAANRRRAVRPLVLATAAARQARESADGERRNWPCRPTAAGAAAARATRQRVDDLRSPEATLSMAGREMAS